MNYPHLSLFVKRVTHSQSQVVAEDIVINGLLYLDGANEARTFFCGQLQSHDTKETIFLYTPKSLTFDYNLI